MTPRDQAMCRQYLKLMYDSAIPELRYAPNWVLVQTAVTQRGSSRTRKKVLDKRTVVCMTCLPAYLVLLVVGSCASAQFLVCDYFDSAPWLR